MLCSVSGGRGTQEAAELVRILQARGACLLGVAARGAARRGPRAARTVARCGRAQSRVQDDPDSFLRLELDSAQRLRRAFWRTPEQRRSDVLYHDCISFDSTFGTKRFRMPLVRFVGVDGEGRTVLLGAGAARGRADRQATRGCCGS
jgi:hypothetical protein